MWETGDCELQELAVRFGIKDIRFGEITQHHPIDNSSLAIVRNPNKCILCGDCVRMCQEIQGVGALTFAYRGSHMKVTPAFDRNIADVECIDCGQCRAICPTGAIAIKNENSTFWELLHNKIIE